jgi:hypothetical protein
LRRLSGVIDSKNVLLFCRLGFIDFFNHASKVLNVDGRHVVLSNTEIRQVSGFLKPRFFEMALKYALSSSIHHT